VVAFLQPLADAEQTASNPLAKVVELIQSLKAKIIDDMGKQDKAYAKYSAWCKQSAGEMTYETDKSSEQQGMLTAKVGKLSADIEVSDTKVKDMTKAISKAEAELKEATAIRKKEAEEFTEAEGQLVSTVSTLERALSQLQKQLAGGSAFAQLDTAMLSNVVQAVSAVDDAAALSSSSESALAALVQSQDDSEEGLGAPKGAAYAAQSGGVMGLLEDLKEKAEGQLADLRKAEMQSRNSYALLKQSLEDQMKADTQELGDDKSDKAEAEEGKAESEGSLEGEKKEFSTMSDKKNQLAVTCQRNAADHAANVAARKDELKVLDQAEKILKETTGGAGEAAGYSFLQIRSASRASQQLRIREIQLARSTVMQTVQRLAQVHHSRALAQLASRISAQLKLGEHSSADPFKKVKNLITTMIAKLEKEASAEASEKAYCDAELPKSKAKVEALEDVVTKIAAKAAKTASQSSQLKQEVRDTISELSSLAKEEAEIDRIRGEENEAHIVAKRDLEIGLNGVRKALTTLRDYYGAEANAGAMLQESDSTEGDGDDRNEMASLMQEAAKQPAPPEKGGKSTGAGGGIIQTLEVIESDFAKNLATEEAEESDAQSTYDKMKQTNKIAKAEKEQTVTSKTRSFKALDKTLSTLAQDKATEVEELQAVTKYYGMIKDRCIAKPTSYDEIKARREAEIQGLKEALASLESEALMQTSRRSSRRLRGDAIADDV
jgi:hypothetical protein